MNIAVFSTMAGAPWGGSEELWHATAAAAIRAGHRVIISTFHWGAPPPKLQALLDAGALHLPRPRRPGRLASWLGLTPPWLAELERFAPDAVLLSQGSAYECAARRATRPLLTWLTRRGVPVVNLVQFNRPDVKRDRATLRLAQGLYRSAAANLFVCQRNAEQAAQWLGQPVPRSRVVCNPVNLPSTAALPLPPLAEGQPIRLACVARLEAATKGQDLLLHALADVLRRHPGGLSLTLAGQGRDLQPLTELRDRLGLSADVAFAGQVTTLTDLWRTHHALALPSHAEGTPLAMVEAMLLGRPALVTDVGGCADWVRDGVDGWVVPAPSHDTLAAGLLRLLADRSHLPGMAAAARQRAVELHDPQPGDTVLSILTAAATDPQTPPTPSPAPAPARRTGPA